jgi:hypothetical protein
MKICPVGAESFHEDRRTDMTKLIVAFCQFANVPKNEMQDWASLPHSLCLYQPNDFKVQKVIRDGAMSAGPLALSQVYIKYHLPETSAVSRCRVGQVECSNERPFVARRH